MPLKMLKNDYLFIRDNAFEAGVEADWVYNMFAKYGLLYVNDFLRAPGINTVGSKKERQQILLDIVDNMLEPITKMCVSSHGKLLYISSIDTLQDKWIKNFINDIQAFRKERYAVIGKEEMQPHLHEVGVIFLLDKKLDLKWFNDERMHSIMKGSPEDLKKRRTAKDRFDWVDVKNRKFSVKSN